MTLAPDQPESGAEPAATGAASAAQHCASDSAPSDTTSQAAGARPSGRTPMKQTVEDEALTAKLLAAAEQELRQFVERTERLAAEKQDITDQMKEVMAEA
ncbi:GapR family DNA-binding domain-containing protein, partial [Pseudoroseicyclus aestuarii]